MNSFNETQLETIKALARSHHKRIFSNPALRDIPADAQKFLEGRYVEDIIRGLTDPDYWKE